MSNQDLAKEIVDYVRACIVHSENRGDGVKWDEMQEGAAWLDNEVDFALSLLYITNKTNNEPLLDAHSVEEYQNGLEHFSIDILKFVKFIVVDMKGTNNQDLFLFRDLATECKKTRS